MDLPCALLPPPLTRKGDVIVDVDVVGRNLEETENALAGRLAAIEKKIERDRRLASVRILCTMM